MAITLISWCATTSTAQTSDPGTTYRVFLKDGSPLASYGEPAPLDDRLVFNLLVRADGDAPTLQLMSVPIAAVDVDRTTRYTDAVRTQRYAATRGETDYTAMTTAARQTLDRVAATTDRRQQLRLVEDARQALVNWPPAHYHYRDKDVHELLDLFDDLVTEMRRSAGESAFSVELVAGTPPPQLERLLPPPSLRESIALALAASVATDVIEERLAILRAAAEAVGPDDADLRRSVNTRLNEELDTSAAYNALTREFRTNADAAAVRGDTATVGRLQAELSQRDQQLGEKRPQQIAALVADLRARFEAAATRRLALEHYAFVRTSLLAYEQRMRPTLAGLDSVTASLEQIRDMKAMAFERIDAMTRRLSRLIAAAEAVTAPDDLTGVHATFVSALRLAREACTRRRQAVVTNQVQTDREASSAAAGALLLAGEGRKQLVASLYPPGSDAKPVARPSRPDRR